MFADDRSAGGDLLEVGALVPFEQIAYHILASDNPEECSVRLELKFKATEDPAESAEDTVEWGALGFIFMLCVYSFSDAQPSGASLSDYHPKDRFGVKDLHDGLRFSRGELHWRADYLRGRKLKTDILVRPDGTVTLQTWGRGNDALRWIEELNS